MQSKGQDTDEQDIRIRRLENKIQSLQAQEEYDKEQQLDEYEDDNIFDDDGLFMRDDPLPTHGKRQNGPPRDDVSSDPTAKRARIVDQRIADEEPFSYLDEESEEEDHSDSPVKPKPRRRPAGKKAETMKQSKPKQPDSKSGKVQKRTKPLTKKQQREEQRANLYRTSGSLGGSSLFRDVRNNTGRKEQPTFSATKKSEAFKELIASIPEEAREDSKVDKAVLDAASKKFGHGRCKPDGKGGWLLKGMRSSLSHYQVRRSS